MIAGIFIILFWMIPVPFAIGLLVTTWMQDKSARILKSYLFGMVIYLASFQVITVSNMLTINNFFQVCTVFAYGMLGLSLLGILIAGYRKIRKKEAAVLREVEIKDELLKKKRMESLVLWILFGAVVVFQLIQTLRLTYPDGDDAYYVSVATYGVDIPRLYSKIPYTGAYTTMDTRHCLAPFSYLISFFARLSGVSASSIAHSIFPLWFILCAYGIYFLIAREVCREKREVSLFMLLISVLYLFGNYSVYSAETFLMTRIRQGKASLGSFALPLGLYLLFYLAKHLNGKKKERALCYVLLGCNGLAAALFTTMGNFIYPCMLAVGGLCICLSKRDWKKLFPMALSCVPSAVMAVLFLLIR